jgi:hypothetical protein
MLKLTRRRVGEGGSSVLFVTHTDYIIVHHRDYICKWQMQNLFVKSAVTSLFRILKAGQWRTNPWPAVPDWTLMPECRCRTNFSPAFWHLHMTFSISYSKNNTISSCLWTCRAYHFHYLQFGRALGILSPLPTTAFLNAGISDCAASSQSCNGMNINSAEGTSKVPE